MIIGSSEAQTAQTAQKAQRAQKSRKAQAAQKAQKMCRPQTVIINQSELVMLPPIFYVSGFFLAGWRYDDACTDGPFGWGMKEHSNLLK